MATMLRTHHLHLQSDILRFRYCLMHSQEVDACGKASEQGILSRPAVKSIRIDQLTEKIEKPFG